MTTSKVLAQMAELSGQTQYDGWVAFLGKGRGSPQELHDGAAKLLLMQVCEFQKLLPEGCVWLPSASQIVGPAGTELAEVFGFGSPYSLRHAVLEAMEMAAHEVIDRYAKGPSRPLHAYPLAGP